MEQRLPAEPSTLYNKFFSKRKFKGWISSVDKRGEHSSLKMAFRCCHRVGTHPNVCQSRNIAPMLKTKSLKRYNVHTLYTEFDEHNILNFTFLQCSKAEIRTPHSEY